MPRHAVKKKTDNAPEERASKPKSGKTSARQQRNVVHDIVGTCLMTLGILSLLAIFTQSIGVVGQYISSVLFGMTGVFAYIMPLLIIAVGFLILIAWKNNLSVVKQLSIALLILSAVTLAHVATGATIPTDGGYAKHILDAYAYGSMQYTGGGMLGGIVTWPLLYLFGVTGTAIIMSAAALCAIIVITRLSLVDLGRNAATHVVEATRTVRERIPRREEGDYVPARRKELYNEVLGSGGAPAAKRKEPVLPVLEGAASGKRSGAAEEPELPAFDEDRPYPFPGLRAGIKSRRGAPPSLPDDETYDEHDAERSHVIPFPIRRPHTPIQQAASLGVEDDGGPPYDTIEMDAVGKQFDALYEDAQASLAPVAPDESATPTDDELEPLFPGEMQPGFRFDVDIPEDGEYKLPPTSLLLLQPEKKSARSPQEEMESNARVLEETFASFGITVKVVNVARGPAITRYELQPAPGVKISRITSLADDIAMNLAAAGVRIEAPIPGKAAVGIEVPNADVSIVSLREMLESDEFKSGASKLTAALGRDIAGKAIIADIARMPHMLIAGQTGAGKSACINSLISSMLYKATPDELKLILIDPKMVELNVYNGIPHLLIPVVTDPKKAAGALGWAVQEMTERYKRFADTASRDIKGYNQKLKDAGEPQLPQIVVIIDELADLMMVAPGEVEDRICRLAQLARAAGIHLVIATQRPSVNVITGVIKANIPSRIAFAVASQVDSRTILDMAGAEKLLGRGDMLFYPSGASKPLRVQGAFVTEGEVERLVEFIKRGSDTPEYDPDLMEHMDKQEDGGEEPEKEPDDADELLPQAILMALDAGQVSVSMLQRRFRIGYSRAGRLIDAMEQRGIVSGFEGSKPRNVLISRDEFQRVYGDGK